MNKAALLGFDMADHLDGEDAIVEYLTQVLIDGDTDELSASEDQNA